MLARWMRRSRQGNINEDPELKPRRSEATVFFVVGITLVVVALVIMSVVGGIIRHNEQQAPVEGRTSVENRNRVSDNR